MCLGPAPAFIPNSTLLKKNKELLEALAAFWRVFRIFRVLISGRIWVIGKHWYSSQEQAGHLRRSCSLLSRREFLSAINTHIFARADFCACIVGFLFGQTIHQTSHSRERYIWVVFVSYRGTGRVIRDEHVRGGRCKTIWVFT